MYTFVGFTLNNRTTNQKRARKKQKDNEMDWREKEKDREKHTDGHALHRHKATTEPNTCMD